MLHESRPTAEPTSYRSTRRILDGVVRGAPDCWVVVARDELDLLDWIDGEEIAVCATPMTVCSAILDDGVLVLTSADEAHDGAPGSDLAI